MKNEIINNDALTVRVNAEAVENVVEAGVEAVEDAATEVVTIVKNNPWVLAGVAVVAVSVGAFVGYKYAERKLQTRFDDILTQEIAESKEFFKRLNKQGEFSTPESAAEALGGDPQESELAQEAAEAVQQYQGKDDSGRRVNYNDVPAAQDDTNHPEGVEVQVNNIFLNGQPVDVEEFDYDTELAKRDPQYPYIVTDEEFFENAPEHEQVQVTYYAGDDTLVDEQSSPIPNEDIVGTENLRFGHGSKDKNLVYVRNEQRGLDFEVCRSEGAYSEVVLGMRHSDEPRSMRLRRGDIE